MRVFYFLTKSEAGGAQTVVYELLQAHKTRGDEVLVMANGTGWLAQKTLALGFAYRENRYLRKTFNPFMLVRAVILYRKSVHDWKPDIVSCHSSFSGFLGRVGLLNAYPVVYTAHGWGFSYGGHSFFKLLFVLAEKIATFFCKRIICVCNADMAIAEKFHIVPETKITVIHNGVSVNAIPGIPKEKIQIECTARFAHPKRQDLILEAFALLPKVLQEKTELLFIGSGPNEMKLREQTKQLKITDSVRFLVKLSREESLPVRANTAFSVLISDSEGFPMTVIESLQLGVPIIANNVGGVAEAVDDSVGQLLSRNPNPKEIATLFEKLILNEQLRKKLGVQAKVRGKEFSAEKMAEKTFALFESVIRRYGK